jgi:DeoR family glycerol-3-phosphate regulon repressor
LVDRFKVSPMTVRRDITAMERAGEIQRTHGGVLVPGGQVLLVEPPFRQRETLNAESKRAIAHTAASLVRSQQTIGVDVGTSTLALCPYLVAVGQLTVITTSLPAASSLAAAIDVYLPAGRVRANELSLVGSTARDGVAQYHYDLVFIGAAALDEVGCYDYSIEDTEIKHALIRNAQRVVVLCDASKFGRRAAVTVCKLASITTLVTERTPPPEIGAALAAAGVEVLVAGAGDAR